MGSHFCRGKIAGYEERMPPAPDRRLPQGAKRRAVHATLV
jgi:hypothetical protein